MDGDNWGKYFGLFGGRAYRLGSNEARKLLSLGDADEELLENSKKGTALLEAGPPGSKSRGQRQAGLRALTLEVSLLPATTVGFLLLFHFLVQTCTFFF